MQNGAALPFYGVCACNSALKAVTPLVASVVEPETIAVLTCGAFSETIPNKQVLVLWSVWDNVMGGLK
jgi:hypothetical protein